jgi:hypothetical protein
MVHATHNMKHITKIKMLRVMRYVLREKRLTKTKKYCKFKTL